MSVPEWAPATAGESVRWQGQPRKRVVHQGIAVGAVAGLAVAAVTVWLRAGPMVTAAGLGLAVLLFAIPAGSAWLWRRSTSYVLTDAALYHRTGVLSVTVTELRLGKIQNTSYSQGIFGTAFNFGTITVDTAGSEGAELRLRALDGPKAVHQRIAKQSGHAKGRAGDEIPGSLEQWQAIRAEVRRLRATLVGE